jgi:DNA repair exonuclease SbcCD nuclease subunit
MGRIFITGDLHGEVDIHRLNTAGFVEQKELTRDDYLIIAGDFGLVWNMDKTDQYWLKWMDEKNFTTLFIDGNHENFDLLDAYPVTEWNGGKVHQIMPNIYHLMRGQMFTIHGKKFFTFGGASSVDIERRIEGKSWWPREIPSYAEFEEGLATLEKHGWKTDYVVTHNCPTKTLEWMAAKYGFYLKPPDAVNAYLDRIKENLEYKHWFFGHFHENLNLPDNLAMLYYDIIELKGEENS